MLFFLICLCNLVVVIVTQDVVIVGNPDRNMQIETMQETTNTSEGEAALWKGSQVKFVPVEQIVRKCLKCILTKIEVSTSCSFQDIAVQN